MTASSAPRATSLGRWLEGLSRAARMLASRLVATVCARFALAEFEHAFSASSANFADIPVPHDDALAHPQDPIHAGDDPGPGAGSAKPHTGPPLGGAPRRMTLGVNFGDPRSEVYVNGKLVGQTPFLGDTACKSGLPVRIEIVARSGPPLTYVRTCVGAAIEIETPPP
ncbi:MAG TPA: hypothetical protein VH142_16065 [Polyangiaceae bacterium]|nr:hypothetical protein [Polyangiaceae bacterium]